MAKILIVSGNLKNWNKVSGGVERTATLAEAFPDHDVTFLCFAWDNVSEESIIDNNIKFIRVGLEQRALNFYRANIKYAAKNNYDIVSYLGKSRIIAFKNKLKQLALESDILILDHYSVAPLVEDVASIIPIIYNSHNAEITMARQLYPSDLETIKAVQKMESIAIEKSVAMTYCSVKDFKELSEEYNTPIHSMYVPNGTEMKTQTDPFTRMKSKDIIFVGSGHPPNVVAVKKIIKIAQDNPEYNFIACGNASNAVIKDKLPPNFKALGGVSESQLDELFRNSLAFINPMESGSGTHLKIMKALSYGIPIITSEIGARGFSEAEKQDCMLITDNLSMKDILAVLSDNKKYKKLSDNGYKLSKQYDWEVIKSNYSKFVLDVIKKHKDDNEVEDSQKEKILIYSIVRNIEHNIEKYYKQLKMIVANNSKQYKFYLSIYENDSTDRTKQKLFSYDWSFFNGVSIVTDTLDTEFFGPVKDPIRVENLSHARNKAIEAGNFLNDMDYVLMLEGDITFDATSIYNILNFKKKEPKFDIVSAVSLRENGDHYDWWATRTGPVFVTKHSELDKNYKDKEYGKYYSTSNGICLYRAEAFKKGARHHWINTVTNEFDCEMVVLCQQFHDLGHSNIYILYNAFAHHHKNK